jgi:hypothetical protein
MFGQPDDAAAKSHTEMTLRPQLERSSSLPLLHGVTHKGKVGGKGGKKGGGSKGGGGASSKKKKFDMEGSLESFASPASSTFSPDVPSGAVRDSEGSRFTAISTAPGPVPSV